MTPHFEMALDMELKKAAQQGRDEAIREILKQWEKALRHRNGGTSGLAKVVETFDAYIRGL